MKTATCFNARAGAALLSLAAGCAHFQPRPLSPPQALDAFGERTLNRADLGSYLSTNGVAASWPLAQWDLPSLTLAAFFYSPELDTARAQLAVSEGELKGAGERPNPSISAAPGYNTTRTAGTVSYWIADVALSIPIETAGKRGYRVAQASHLAKASRLSLAQAAWQVRREVRASLLEVYAAQEAEAQARRSQALQADASALLQKQADAGAIARSELARARLQEQSSALDVLSARQKQAAARVRLARAVGVPAQALADAALDFDAIRRLPPALPSAELQRAALLNRPDLLASLEAYEASQAALQLEVAKQYPDVELGPAYQYDQGDNKWALGFTVTLPLFNRNQGAIAAAEARRAEAAAAFKALQSRAIGDVEQAQTAYRFALEKVEAARRLSAGLEQKERAAQALRAAGEVSRLEVLAERIERASAEQACLEARLEALQALGEVEDALQTPADLPDWSKQISAAGAASSEGTNHE